MKVVWADIAVADLDDIHDYIGRDSAHYAKQFDRPHPDCDSKPRVFSREIGRSVPEAEDMENVREMLFEAYRIQYRIEPTRVLVVAVIHGSRDVARMPRAPWEVD